MFKSNSFLKVELISKQITDGKPNFSELVLSFWWTDSKKRFSDSIASWRKSYLLTATSFLTRVDNIVIQSNNKSDWLHFARTLN